MRRICYSLLIVFALSAVSCVEPSSGALRPRARAASATPSASVPRWKSEGWKKPRYITVEEAVARLQPHVDLPVVLPHSARAGLPDLDGWLADPRYMDWRVVDGIRAGSLTLRTRGKILILSYGLATFDGCGDRTTSEETEVRGQPALVSDSPGHTWSHVLWPVTPTGSTGRYGIAGTFDAKDMLLLAESMERERLEAMDHDRSC